jgi:RNA polymerase sigma factor (sigma-70 family)
VSDARRKRFELEILPHLPAAYGLARWLLRHRQDAEDAVQDAVLRAYRGFDGFAGDNPSGWLLAIVRNTCMTLIERRRTGAKVVAIHDGAREAEAVRDRLATDPATAQDTALIAREEQRGVHQAIALLPLPYREVLVLREFNDLSYREIAHIVGAPVGTVMSRLARARERLRDHLREIEAAGPQQNGKKS